MAISAAALFDDSEDKRRGIKLPFDAVAGLVYIAPQGATNENGTGLVSDFTRTTFENGLSRDPENNFRFRRDPLELHPDFGKESDRPESDGEGFPFITPENHALTGNEESRMHSSDLAAAFQRKWKNDQTSQIPDHELRRRRKLGILNLEI